LYENVCLLCMQLTLKYIKRVSRRDIRSMARLLEKKGGSQFPSATRFLGGCPGISQTRGWADVTEECLVRRPVTTNR